MRVHLLAGAFLVLLPAVVLAQAGRRQVAQGNRLFAQEKYEAAANKYRDALNHDPLSPIVHFNLGTTDYKRQNYEDALKDFDKALNSPDVATQAKAYYNIGNTLFRMGKLPESILAYQRALQLDPNDVDAKYNLELVRALLKNSAQKQSVSQQQEQQQEQQKQEGQQGQQQQGQKREEEQQQERQEQGEQQAGEAEEQQGKEKDMSKEDAERILDALNQSEKDAQQERKVPARGSRRVLKDW
ncbi:MAG: tetratricopeptide repeat protein [candidate division KSB1 bacterium]|nr:tetratricopeptide repeat protein [candidate division KSB1 bacterium]MDZ7386544.1 tetratricopeptide repeat protein [candidate division KSB1 bacterium]MDZ7393376.1 tetratricopeptide repeat protein [candidate division KSB1 bacterium]MDZ7414044.1 tetratricopeptide repeat protein [candidate division KSB1 bacterium]